MVANICIAIFIIRLHKVSVHGKLCIWTVYNRKNEFVERYGYRNYHVYIGRYLGLLICSVGRLVKYITD